MCLSRTRKQTQRLFFSGICHSSSPCCRERKTQSSVKGEAWHRTAALVDWPLSTSSVSLIFCRVRLLRESELFGIAQRWEFTRPRGCHFFNLSRDSPKQTFHNGTTQLGVSGSGSYFTLWCLIVKIVGSSRVIRQVDARHLPSTVDTVAPIDSAT